MVRAYNKKREIVVSSDMMKIVVAGYYRFTRQYKYTCTEYNHFDICACDGKTLIEIECKISKSDLKRETQKVKHKYYSGEKHSKYKIIPNKYFFCITRKMYEDNECISFIKELNPNYGIFIVDNWRQPIMVKQAKKLQDKDISDKIKEDIVMRISSENINLRKKIYDIKNGTI